MIVKIDKGVSMPRRYRPSKYPWLVMDVGDSFPCENYEAAFVNANLASKRYAPKRFEARKLNGTMHIWRVR